MAEGDADLITRWLGHDHVRAWWGEPATRDSIAAKYGPRIRGESPTEMFIVTADGGEVGMIQRYRSADHPDYVTSIAPSGVDASGSAGIDYVVGEPGRIGKGLGSTLIAAFTDKLFAELEEIERVLVTPQAANVASCRALEKAGYERLWLGMLDSDDPSDSGEAALYAKDRPPSNAPASSYEPS